ncbi:hypothetical protein, partial [Pseudonocardia sp. NPDC046786]|uniref:hypothetical protein n=1 Tax=Pseudonocardia sp. NPDC046786 TaxID=3155471 RepID=UPI0033CEFB3D
MSDQFAGVVVAEQCVEGDDDLDQWFASDRRAWIGACCQYGGDDLGEYLGRGADVSGGTGDLIDLPDAPTGPGRSDPSRAGTGGSGPGGSGPSGSGPGGSGPGGSVSGVRPGRSGCTGRPDSTGGPGSIGRVGGTCCAGGVGWVGCQDLGDGLADGLHVGDRHRALQQLMRQIDPPLVQCPRVISTQRSG